MNVENVIQENSSTTIRTQLTNIGVSLALLLTDIRGLVLSFVLRYGNVESFVPTATESTPSNSRDTTQRTLYEPVSMTSQKSTVLQCSNPSDWINDIVNGRTALDSVRMDHWLQLVCMAMVEEKSVDLEVDVPYKGGLYSLHHCIKIINPPAQTSKIMGVQH